MQKVQLFISCRSLPQMDLLSSSDPMVVVKKYQHSGYFEVGRTEYKKNDSNPNFKNPIIVDYQFQTPAPLRFEVYDLDNQTECKFLIHFS